MKETPACLPPGRGLLYEILTVVWYDDLTGFPQLNLPWSSQRGRSFLWEWLRVLASLQP